VIYIDSSVALATINDEMRQAPASFWSQRFVASRLVDCELRVRTLAHQAWRPRLLHLEALLANVAFVEIDRASLERLYEPLPLPVRTLDAIHLSTMSYLSRGTQRVTLATYDRRLTVAAQEMGFDVIAP
jgi:predicted nucleic acid-binding protein